VNKKRFLARLYTTAVIISIIFNLCFAIFLLQDWSRIRLIGWNLKRSMLYSPKEEHAQTLHHISAIVRSQAFTKAELIDQVRIFVHSNTVHIDAGNKYAAFNTPYALSRMLQTYKSNQKPLHLTCGSRAFAMKAILDYMGIDSRSVNIYTDEEKRLRAHSFLEVENPDTKRWEIQDPEFNVYYVDSKTKERLSSIHMLFYEKERVIPVSKDGLAGWDVNNVQKIYKKFKAVVYDTKNLDNKSIVIIRRERFDISRRFPENNNENFIEFANHNFGNPLFLFY